MPRLPLLMILLCAGTAVAAPVYQVVDKDGKVTYTDKPPSDTGAANSREIEQKAPNIMEAPKGQDFRQNFDEHRKAAQEESKSAWEAYDQALAEAEERLRAARQAQKESEEVREGDMIAMQNRGFRGSRPQMRFSEEYLERQQALQKAVEEAEAHLANVRRQKPALRRN